MTALLTESQLRLYDKFYSDLGSEIIEYLSDHNINEIMVNPDGGLWIDSSTNGQHQVGTLSLTQRLAIINGIAGIQHFVINAQTPHLEAVLPHFNILQGQRFTAIVPPVASSPCFTIRKRPEKIYSLSDYVATGRLSLTQQALLCDLVKTRQNILVCGGPGSGKTTITNALIAEAVKHDPKQRFLILEDTPELQCTAPNQVSLLSSCHFSMTLLLRMAMRFRPDRILIGEVRGAEALDMLKAWNTGCPGGIGTVHANGAEEAVHRILDLAMEAGLVAPPVSLVQHTIGAIIFVARRDNHKGFIQDILKLGAYQHGHFTFETLA